MSRRTKYLIAALFLALLAVPVLYVVFTWAPGNPIRYHVVMLPAEKAAGLEPHEKYLVLLENVSNGPVTFLGSYTTPTDDYGTGYRLMDFAYAQHEIVALEEYQLPLPPGGRLIVPMDGNDHTACVQGLHQWAHYICVSRTKFRAMKLLVGLEGRLPASLRKHVPVLAPDLESTPLDVLTEAQARKLMGVKVEESSASASPSP